MNIVLAIVSLSFLILVHELGHFMVARWAGVKVLEFSIFMGPKLFSWKKGDTVYSVRAIPMGGFVKMEGEEEASTDERAFNKKPAGKRALVIAAGAIMNIMIAIIILSIIAFSIGYHTRDVGRLRDDSPFHEAGILVGDTLLSYNGKHVFHANDFNFFLFEADGSPVEVVYRREGVKERQRTTVTPRKVPGAYVIGITVGVTDEVANNTILQVAKGSPADIAGLKPQDVIIRVDDVEIQKRIDMANYLAETQDRPVDITVLRNGEPLTVTDVVPVQSETYYDLGVQFEHRKGDFFGTIGNGVAYSLSTIRSVFYTIGWLFTGRATFRDISGPVGIVAVIGDVVEMGRGLGEKALNLLQITAFLSLNLGVMNLLPFPALDGGKLVLILVEKIRRKPLDPEKEAWISMVGFFLLILLLIATLFNDIPRIFRG